MKCAWALALAGVMTLTAGCILDNTKSDTDTSNVHSIHWSGAGGKGKMR